MKCLNCNKEIDNDSKFCSFCGKSITIEQPTAKKVITSYKEKLLIAAASSVALAFPVSIATIFSIGAYLSSHKGINVHCGDNHPIPLPDFCKYWGPKWFIPIMIGIAILFFLLYLLGSFLYKKIKDRIKA